MDGCNKKETWALVNHEIIRTSRLMLPFLNHLWIPGLWNSCSLVVPYMCESNIDISFLMKILLINFENFSERSSSYLEVGRLSGGNS